MKIRKLYRSSNRLNTMVVQTMDGKFYYFFDTPFRKVKESELRPLPAYIARGRQDEEAAEYFYQFYGFEKVCS